MYGDRLMLYDKRADMFFVCFTKHWTMKRGASEKAIWVKYMSVAWVTSNLSSIQKKRRELGPDVKIVTETQARRIEEMRALDEEYNRSRKAAGTQ